MSNEKNILLIGFGNPGRRDDGLGPAMAQAVEDLRLPGVTVEADYQLTVEDAAEAAGHDVVVFADAAAAGPDPFWVKRIQGGDGRVSFSSHSVSPEAVLALARDLFGASPKGYLLGIRGYEFNEFGESLSPRARENLQLALDYWRQAWRSGFQDHFREIRAEGWDLPSATTSNEDEPCKMENT